MLHFFARRLALSIFVLIGMSSIVFVVTHIYGDPARMILPIGATESQYLAMREHLGLNDPIHVQYLRYAAGLARGDFGSSLWQKVPALDLVLMRLPATMQLALASTFFALIFAIPLGIISALKAGTWVDTLIGNSSLIGVSIANFWLALLLILVFSLKLGLFPTSGHGELKHLILPTLAAGLLPFGRLVQVVRTETLQQLRKNYVVTARAKGAQEPRVVLKHVLKNTSIPITTMAGYELARMVAGYAVVVETVFAWPGTGLLAVQAIQRHDFPLIQADLIVVATLVLMINLLVDVLHGYLDPRIRLTN